MYKFLFLTVHFIYGKYKMKLLLDCILFFPLCGNLSCILYSSSGWTFPAGYLLGGNRTRCATVQQPDALNTELLRTLRNTLTLKSYVSCQQYWIYWHRTLVCRISIIESKHCDISNLPEIYRFAGQKKKIIWILIFCTQYMSIFSTGNMIKQENLYFILF